MSRPKIPLGRDALSNAIRWLLEQDERRKIIKSPDVAPEETARGTALRINEVKVAPQVGSSVTLCRVKVIGDDAITCRAYDGTFDSGPEFSVAMPWRLRKTGWHGNSVSYDFNGGTVVVAYNYTAKGYRTATVTSVTPNSAENQAIIPLYRVNDLIFSTEPDGGTGIDGVSTIDLNVDARAWARI